VVAAEASLPSPWPLLDNAALRVVKSRWRFVPGPMRAYEVAIRFQLNK
jgi:outer membrane biosynthesis protein TonB